MSVNMVCLPYPFSRFPHQGAGFAPSISQTIDREQDGPDCLPTQACRVPPHQTKGSLAFPHPTADRALMPLRVQSLVVLPVG